jgi:FMN-dependent NADH-azoreductase
VKRLLHIDASPRGDRSRSGAVGDHLLARLRTDDPALAVETLDLWQADMPPFDGAVIEGRYRLLMGEDVDPDMAAGWARVRAVANHFMTFDGWLFTVPMWNFGIPYRLKQYVDLVTHPGMTFRNDAAGNVDGLAAGRTAIIVAASAMSADALAGLDFQRAYLDAWLRFIGVTDIRSIRVAPTFGPPDQVDAAMARGRAEADAIADALQTERAARV